MKKDTLSNVLSLVLTVCAVLVTGMLVRREFFAPTARAQPPAERRVEGWKEAAEHGRVIGAAGAQLRIVEFADFQCPFCAQVSARLDSIRQRAPGRVAVVYRHFPLEGIHPYARAAALASECAGDQGRFKAYHDALYAEQALIGSKGWDAFAEAAGVPRVDEFRVCVAEERFAGRVEEDLRAARALQVDETPTFIFDGRLVTGAYAVGRLDEWVRKSLD